MPDFAKGKIYRIISPNCDKVYIGSTTATLNNRFSNHKSACKTENSSSKVVIESGDAVIELLENFPCESKKELERREGEIIRITENRSNATVAGRTNKEWRADTGYYQQYQIDNAVRLAAYQQQHRIDNADKIREQSKQWRADNAVEIADKQRQYYIDNVERLRENRRQYRIDNADMIREYHRQYNIKKKANLISADSLEK